MGKVIPFKPRKKPAPKDPLPLSEDVLNERVIASIAPDIESLKKDVMGESLSPEEDFSKLKHFIYNALILKFRDVARKFRSITYISELFGRPNNISPEYVVDLIAEGAPPYRIADNCLVIAGLWPEWLNRRGNSMKRSDYLEIGSSYYLVEASSRLDGSRPLYEDLGRNIAAYADALYEIRCSLSLKPS